MKKIVIVFFALTFFVTNAFSAGDYPVEVIILDIYRDEDAIQVHEGMRSSSTEGMPLVDFYYDDFEPVVYVNVIPNPSDVVVYIINYDTNEVAYDIVPAGNAETDIAISGSTGRYEVFYYAPGDVPSGFASVGSAGQFIVY